MTILRIAMFVLLAQAPPPQIDVFPGPINAPLAAQQTGSGTIEGIVVKNGSGESLPGVTVWLSQLNSQRTLRATTGSDGKFVFGNLPAAPYSLSAQRSGYLEIEFGQRGPNGHGTPIVLRDGQRMTGVQLAMTPTGVISGRVLDRNGDPISRAQVQALKFVYQDGIRTLSPVQTVSTNDLGEYRLFWLPAGRYLIGAVSTDPQAATVPVSIIPPGPYSGRGPILFVLNGSAIASARPGVGISRRKLEDGSLIEEAQAPIFYPNTTDALAAAPIEVRAGGTVSGMDIAVGPTRVQRIRGVVVNGATGGPALQPTVSLVPRTPGLSQAVASLPQARSGGAFEIAGVVPGSYTLIASEDTLHAEISTLAGASSGAVSIESVLGQYGSSLGIVPIEIGKTDVENVTIKTLPRVPISGRVLIEGGPVTGADRSVSVAIRGDPRMVAQLKESTRIGDDGSFRFENVLPADYQVIAQGPSDLYVKSIRMGSADVLMDGLHLAGPVNGLLEIIFARNPGRIRGKIRNDRREPVANVTVVSVPEPTLRHRSDLYVIATTDDAGSFELRVPPGNYRVFGFEDIEKGMWQDPDFIRTIENRGRAVNIGEGAIEDIELAVIPGQL